MRGEGVSLSTEQCAIDEQEGGSLVRVTVPARAHYLSHHSRTRPRHLQPVALQHLRGGAGHMVE